MHGSNLWGMISFEGIILVAAYVNLILGKKSKREREQREAALLVASARTEKQ